MSAVVWLLVIGFGLLLLMDVPIAVAIAIATFLCIFASGGDATYTVALKMANGIDSFTLLAIPFFILSGLLMGQGGIARRLIDFAAACVGRFPGGLAYVNTLTCMLFGSISGSAAAAVSSVGGFMIPEMNRKGYPRDFNVALTVTSATTGLIIPPSNIMIVYAVAAGGVSIVGLFLAGIVPGILVGLCLMSVCFFWAKGRKLEREPAVSWSELLSSFVRAVPSLLLVIVVIGGILGGIFTATEAAAIAVAYAFVLAVLVYREVKLADLPAILLKGAVTTSVVMLLIGASSGMSWLLTTQNVPQQVSTSLLAMSDNPFVILLAINLLLLAVGTFMDMTPAVLIFTPIFLPVVVELGMDPLQFGIVMITNLCVGLCTPPVGTCLFLGCGVGKTTIAKVTPSLLPFFFAMIVALLLITYLPGLSLWIPSLFGKG
ncbi:Sialic acid TRAP transporter permease protein SiaT [Planctomycetes bacterium CA13]|uniref:Sialic acid TRAP transporter permease protein SiaT n=1 Tax=Novipirellula herctigrandis TaxID=2527986 RepID=A0A5C5YW62_9BACT|nr:Sialic acid TRAP transporter permease protein SiaT [Planctomycetes bacterium CA13]